MAGETETGVTIMRVVKALDAGPMLSRFPRAIGPDETSVDVELDLAALGARALIEAVDAIAAGASAETPQNDSDATYAPKIVRSDGIVDWSRPALAIHNQIRGLHPWPHAFSDLDGERIILLESQVGAPSAAEASPGTIVQADGNGLGVQTGGDILRLVRLQREGRRPLTAREFLAGHRLVAGSRFTASTTAP